MSSAKRPPSRSGGFTLLEVMCAFAILVGITGAITRLWFTAVEQGSEAVGLRELREAADTVFRRLCYEDGRHPDGMTDTLDNFYANWADLKTGRDRWAIYGMEYHRKPRTAAGSETNEASPLFESSRSGSKGSGSTGSGTTSPGTGGTGAGGAGSAGTGTPAGTGTGTAAGAGAGTGSSSSQADEKGVMLYQITLRIFLVDEGPQKPLITLQTYLPSTQDSTDTTGTASGGR